MTTIKLTPDVFVTCCAVGMERYHYAITHGCNPLDAGDYDGRRGTFDFMHSHVLGACGEYACCHHIGVRWPAQLGVSKTPVPDLVHQGVRYEFRTTTHTNGHLQLKSDDAVDVWVLVVAQAPSFTIVGCTTASRGMQEQYRRSPWDGTPSPHWWVPQSQLLPFPVGGFTRPDLAQLERERAALARERARV